MTSKHISLFLFGLCLWLAAGPLEAAPSRHALVIGNGSYATTPIAHAVADAQTVAAKLRATGFNVQSADNVTGEEFERLLDQFSKGLSKGATVLFYYVGHGIQHEGRNYLVPVDALPSRLVEIPLGCIALSLVEKALAPAGKGAKIIVLDAAKVGPFGNRLQVDRPGLVQITPASGTFYLLADSPGRIDRDVNTTSGRFSAAFKQVLSLSDLPLSYLAKLVKTELETATERRRIPWIADGLKTPVTLRSGRSQFDAMLDAAAGKKKIGAKRFREAILAPVSLPRHALIMDNSAYGRAPLQHPAADAALLQSALTEIGFDVLRVSDGTRQQMQAAIDRYRRRLVNGGIGLVYFGGYGIQVEGENYLLPVDARAATEGGVIDTGFALEPLLESLHAAGNDFNLVIVDAAHGHPFGDRFEARRQGLAPLDAPTDLVLVYSTTPQNQIALPDGRVAAEADFSTKDNVSLSSMIVKDLVASGFTTALIGADPQRPPLASVFGQQLSRQLKQPDQKLNESLFVVAQQVSELSEKRFVPWIKGEFDKAVVLNDRVEWFRDLIASMERHDRLARSGVNRTLKSVGSAALKQKYGAVISGADDDWPSDLVASAMLAGSADERSALVIVNAPPQGTLLTPGAKDAAVVADALTSIGFSVRTLINAGREEITAAIEAFGDRLRPGGIGVFYFGGQAVQIDGINYLVPTGAKIDYIDAVVTECVPLARVMEGFDYSRSQLNLAIIDAVDLPQEDAFFLPQPSENIRDDIPQNTILIESKNPGQRVYPQAELPAALAVASPVVTHTVAAPETSRLTQAIIVTDLVSGNMTVNRMAALAAAGRTISGFAERVAVGFLQPDRDQLEWFNTVRQDVIRLTRSHRIPRQQKNTEESVILNQTAGGFERILADLKKHAILERSDLSVAKKQAGWAALVQKYDLEEQTPVGMLQAAMRQSPAGASETRTALVIGNRTGTADGLPDGIADATALAEMLSEYHFEVDLVTDADKRRLQTALDEFETILRGGGIGLVYFVGQARQFDGSNYLLPSGVVIDAPEEIPDVGIALQSVFDALTRAANSVNFVFLDAAYDPDSETDALEPESEDSETPAIGLAEPEPPANTLVVLSTEPDAVILPPGATETEPDTETGEESDTGQDIETLNTPESDDNDIASQNSTTTDSDATELESDLTLAAATDEEPDTSLGPFTATLLKLIDKSNQAVTKVLDQLKPGVLVASQGRQIPWWPDPVPEPAANFIFASDTALYRRLAVDLKRLQKLEHPAVANEYAATAWDVMQEKYPDETWGIAKGDRIDLWTKVLAGDSAGTFHNIWAGSGAKWRLIDRWGMEFLYLAPGEFDMGSPSDEPSREDDERQHRVNLTKGFYMMAREVTQAQWQTVTGYNPAVFKDCGENCPVEEISWHDTQLMIDLLNQMPSAEVTELPSEFREAYLKQTQIPAWLHFENEIALLMRADEKRPAFRYRLPSEAEWEYAARAGGSGWFSFGNDVREIVDHAWVRQNSGGRTHPVGQKAPNAWGLYDMHGNVWEWCQDWEGDYDSDSVSNPTGASSGQLRVIRGGSFFYPLLEARSANRYYLSPEVRNYNVGLRLVITP